MDRSTGSSVLVVLSVIVLLAVTGGASLPAAVTSSSITNHDGLGGASVRSPFSSGAGAAGPYSCTNCVIKTLPAGESPSGIAYDSGNGNIYVGNYRGSNLTVIDGATNTVTGSILVALSTRDVTYVPATSYLYVDIINPSNGLGNTMDVVSPATGSVIQTITFSGYEPISPCYDPANGNLYVPLLYAGVAEVVNATTFAITGSVPAGSRSASATCDAVNGDIYVANQDGDSVTVIDGSTNAVVTTIPVGPNFGPYESAFDNANGDIYVGGIGTTANGYVGNSVDVISGATNSVIASIPVGSGPSWLGYDSGDQDIYVANHNDNNVSVISGSTNAVVATIPVAAGPFGTVYDPASGDLYVADESNNSVSVIATGPASSPGPSSSSSSSSSSFPLLDLIILGVVVVAIAAAAVYFVSYRRRRRKGAPGSVIPPAAPSPPSHPPGEQSPSAISPGAAPVPPGPPSSGAAASQGAVAPIASLVPPATSPTTSAAPAPRFCSNCGSTLKSGANFCPSCGTKVNP